MAVQLIHFQNSHIHHNPYKQEMCWRVYFIYLFYSLTFKSVHAFELFCCMASIALESSKLNLSWKDNIVIAN